MDQEAVGVAHFDNYGLAPFAVYEEDLASIGSEMTFYNDKELAPGVFGMLNFDGGNESASDLKEWTADGWDEKVIIDPDDGYVKFDGSTGLKSSISQPAGDHIETGDVVVGCVYSNVEGKSGDASFYVTGFVSMTITEQKLVDEEYEYIKGRVEGVYMGDTGETLGNMHKTVRLHLAE
ncbi:MAG: hypothetical protein ACOCSQ_05560 [Planctomycetota bacterium]